MLDLTFIRGPISKRGRTEKHGPSATIEAFQPTTTGPLDCTVSTSCITPGDIVGAAIKACLHVIRAKHDDHMVKWLVRHQHRQKQGGTVKMRPFHRVGCVSPGPAGIPR